MTHIRQLMEFELELLLVQRDVFLTTALQQIQELSVMVSQDCILCDSNTKHNDVICSSPDSIKSFYYVIKPTLKFLGSWRNTKGHP